jgi:hypothetical protein
MYYEKINSEVAYNSGTEVTTTCTEDAFVQ